MVQGRHIFRPTMDNAHYSSDRCNFDWHWTIDLEWLNKIFSSWSERSLAYAQRSWYGRFTVYTLCSEKKTFTFVFLHNS